MWRWFPGTGGGFLQESGQKPLVFATHVFQGLQHVGRFPQMVVPPKSSILIGISIINRPFWGTTILGNTHVCPFRVAFVVSFWGDVFSTPTRWTSNGFPSTFLWSCCAGTVLGDEQMKNGWIWMTVFPTTVNDEEMSNKVGVEHQSVRMTYSQLYV